jgi:type IV secretion system protein TrbI
MADEKQITALPEPQAVPPAPENASGLRDKRVRPEGVVPKQAQGYVVAGLAVLILMAVMFSKNHAKPAAKDAASAPLAVSTDMNQRKIQELEQDLSADQRQSQQEQQARNNNTSPPAINTAAANAPNAQTSGGAAPASQLPPPATAEPPRDPIADAEKAMVFKARFASNLVTADAGASRPSAEPIGPGDTAPARSSSLPPTAPTRAAGTQSAGANKRAPEVNLNSAHGQPFVIFEGTTIDAILVDRLDGEFAGKFKVMVTNPVYSEDRQHVLIPEGTFILGETQKVSGFGQKRLALTFHRMLMPDNYSVDLDQFQGLDQAGETGVKGKINNHYAAIFGASIALGVIAGAAEATTNSGYNQTGSDAYRQGISSSLSQSSANVLDRFINILPTHTIFEGHRVKVYITQDMLLPAYENHDMPGVM